jgi:hypothetical protein
VADETILIQLKLKAEQFKQKMDAAGGKVKQFATSLQGLAATGAALTIISVAQALGELAIKLDAARTRLELFTGSAAAARGWVRAIQEATGGAVREMDALALSNDLIAFKLAKTADEAATLARQIMLLTGGNMEAAGSFARMMSNQSALRLDEFALSSATVTKRIEELMSAQADLTREEAFNIAVKEQLEIVSNRLAESMDSTSGAAARLTGKLEDIKTDAASAAEQGVAPMIDAIDDLNTAIEQMSVNGVRVENAFSALVLMKELLKDNKIGMLFGANLIEANGNVQTAIEKTTAQYQEMLINVGAISTEESRAADAAAAMASAQQDTATATGDLKDKTRDLNAGLSGMRGEMSDAAAGLDELSTAAERAKHQLKAIRDEGGSAVEGAFEDIGKTAEGGQQSLKGLAAVAQDEADDDTIKMAILAEVKAQTNDPVMIYRARKALGLVTEREAQLEAEARRLVQLFLNGQITDEQFAFGAGALESGNVAAAQGIQGSGLLDPNRPSASGGGRRPPDLTPASGASPFPNATQADHAVNSRPANITINVPFGGSMENYIKGVAVQAFVEGMKQATRSGNGPTRVGG